MKYFEYPPHSSLQNYVKCFWILEQEYTPQNAVEEVIPDACIELIFNFGAPYILQQEGGEERVMPTAFLIGLQKNPLRFRCNGTVRLVATRFHAWGALPFLPIQPRTPNSVTITIDHEWREVSNALEGKVRAQDYDGAVVDLQEFLIAKLLTATFELKQIQAAARLLFHRKGQFKVAELADYCNLSSRQLQRQFQDLVGVSPKTLARAIRFEEIRNQLMFHPDANLTELAYEFEYTDQAHFIHDFKEFAGKTPGEYAAEMQALQSVFRDHENVVFLQFPPSESR